MKREFLEQDKKRNELCECIIKKLSLCHTRKGLYGINANEMLTDFL